MAFPVTLNSVTYTLADFEGLNYVEGFPNALEDFVTEAGTKVTAAGTSATAAATSATASATSATASATSATAAAASATSAAASLDAIEGFYLGAAASDPSTDLNGAALTAGDWYFNTGSDALKVYNGSTFITFSALTFDLVGDTTPQLGGNLDFNGNTATSFASTGIDDNADAIALTINTDENISVGSTANHSSARIVINRTPPTAFGSPMLQVGQEAFVGNGYYAVGLGFTGSGYTEPPAEIAAVSTSSSGGTTADIVFGTRSVTTNTAVTERLRIDSIGQIMAQGSAASFDTTPVQTGLQLYYETDTGLATLGSYSSGGSTSLSFHTNSGGAASAEAMRIDSDAKVNFFGTTSVAEMIEKVDIPTSTTGTINFDFLSQAVQLYNTDQTANRTINFRGDGSTALNAVMAVGESMTSAVLMKQGGSAYYLNAYQVDSSSVTPEWSGGSAPSAGNANSIDAYTFTIIKTADATFTVLASQSQYA